MIVNATAMSIQIASIPFAYSVHLGGCAKFAVQLDPLLPWGVASVYAIHGNGTASLPELDRYPTPKYVSGTACGEFLHLVVDRWRSLGPLIPVTIAGEESMYAHWGVPLVINGSAIVRVRSLVPPSVRGSYAYRVSSEVVRGAYLEEYAVYERAEVHAHGIVDVVYFRLADSERPDYYVYTPARGTRLEGGRRWTPDVELKFAPDQLTVTGRPRLSVEQISVPVVGDCEGSATVLNPLERPLRILVRLASGDEYTLFSYSIPGNITSSAVRRVLAVTADGREVNRCYLTASDGTPVRACIISGVTYYINVRVANRTYSYPALLSNGIAYAHTDLVIPRVVADAPGFAALVKPNITQLGSPVAVRLYYNGVEVAEYTVAARPVINISTSALFFEVRVADILGSPIPEFRIHVGSLKFRGEGGIARVLKAGNSAVVEIDGARFYVALGSEVRVPVMTRASFVRVFLAALSLGALAAALLQRGSRQAARAGGRDVVEV